MAKSLGFTPDALIRVTPGARQKWKLPVKLWVRELHLERFGHVLGEKLPPAPHPAGVEDQEEATRLFGEQLYWEDYWDRNADAQGPKSRSGKPGQPVVTAPALESRNPT